MLSQQGHTFAHLSCLPPPYQVRLSGVRKNYRAIAKGSSHEKKAPESMQDEEARNTQRKETRIIYAKCRISSVCPQNPTNNNTSTRGARFFRASSCQTRFLRHISPSTGEDGIRVSPEHRLHEPGVIPLPVKKRVTGVLQIMAMMSLAGVDAVLMKPTDETPLSAMTPRRYTVAHSHL